jgi:uncharacterized delta-60 repeat protein
MLDRCHRDRASRSVDQRAGIWRHARLLLALTAITALGAGNLQVKAAGAGSLDRSFSNDGKQTTDFGSEHEEPQAVAIQSDGKIVVVGTTTNNMTRSDFAVARYNVDGRLDTTFGGDGKVTTDFYSQSSDTASAVAIQADGKIVVAGYVAVGGSNFAMARYNTDGTLDMTFDHDGKVVTIIGRESFASSIILQPNGKIVLAGSLNEMDFAVARYYSNGRLDPSFSGDGKLTTDLGGFDYATAIALRPNGRILVVGSSNLDGITKFALARYTPSGVLDTTFSGDGKLITYIGVTAEANAVALQPDGKIIVAGSSVPDSDDAQSNDFTLVRYNVDGSLDDGSVKDRTPNDKFGTDGIVITDFFAGLDSANAVAIQPDGKIIAAGYAARDANNSNIDFGVARYNANGTPDQTFDGNGRLITGFYGSLQDVARGLAIQSDGKIVVAGRVQTAGDYDFGLVRYLGD